MAEEKKDELTEKELEKASGGLRRARRSEPGQGGTVVPNEPSGSDDDTGGGGPSVGGVDPMDDPLYQ